MDDFFIDCAVRLGKTQAEFERGYFVMDIFNVLEAHNRSQAEQLLAQLSNATMARTTDVEGYRKYAEELRKKAGQETQSKVAAFDERGFELMRMKLKGGRA